MEVLATLLIRFFDMKVYEIYKLLLLLIPNLNKSTIMMKKTTCILAASFITCSLFVTSCSNSESELNKTDEIEKTTIDEDFSIDSVKMKGTQNYYLTLDGQYPSDTELFKADYLQNRLVNLLGSDQQDFFAYWEVETPIIIENNIIFTTGCQQHNCNANQFILIYDIDNDNINVFRIGTITQEYEERGTIKLPEGIEKEFNIILDNIM